MSLSSVPCKMAESPLPESVKPFTGSQIDKASSTRNNFHIGPDYVRLFSFSNVRTIGRNALTAGHHLTFSSTTSNSALRQSPTRNCQISSYRAGPSLIEQNSSFRVRANNSLYSHREATGCAAKNKITNVHLHSRHKFTHVR